MARALLVTAAILLSACVTNPPRETPVQQPTPPAFDPVGIYDFSVEMMGQTQGGELRLTRQDGQLGGTLSANGQTVNLRNVKLEQRRVTATAVGPQGGPEVQFVFNFEDNDKFAGTLTVPGMGDARIWGARRRSQ